MKITINCFLPYADSAQAAETIKNLQANESIAKIYLLNIGNEAKGECPAGCEMLEVKSLEASSTMRVIAAHADSDFVMVYTKYTTLRPGLFALERMMRLAADSGAGMVYADRYNVTADGHRSNAPVIDYQQGSLRDDFDFGSVEQVLSGRDVAGHTARRECREQEHRSPIYHPSSAVHTGDCALRVSVKDSLQNGSI